MQKHGYSTPIKKLVHCSSSTSNDSEGITCKFHVAGFQEKMIDMVNTWMSMFVHTNLLDKDVFAEISQESLPHEVFKLYLHLKWINRLVQIFQLLYGSNVFAPFMA